ncbi:glutaredoxin family protein [Halobacillus naozhouensis]|uniref:Glutaredoxin family protein n=1 Tax=Halobacillus naozhouensis TaxID=554880 RepID=A0ABY8J0Y5_9BACI|nr:glutaredoxin family protein [Halobacillus naozhouensis]WFT75252.1 glutaredoxin family protein [Halobacillus naozhouensis]
MIGHEVIVYTSNDCVQCEKVLAKLSKWNIAFEERNISKDERHFKDLKAQRIYATPATFFNSEKILGYQERRLRRALGIPYDATFQKTSNISS